MRLAYLFFSLALVWPLRLVAQQPPQPQALPDSTYLWLTLELPEVATFVVRRTFPGGGGERIQLVQQHMVSLDLVGCLLRWRHSRRIDDGRARTNRLVYFETSVPLKELDVKRLDVWPADVTSGLMPDAQHWQVRFLSANPKTRPFLIKNLDNGMQRHERMFGFEVYGHDNARRVAQLLADASQRCDTWNTAPLRPIRSF